ncbi:MAG: hypothetical protein JNK04_22485 [Myxococcales bacterium]|nr:hypothetical protein [Myxococcales bacterium]
MTWKMPAALTLLLTACNSDAPTIDCATADVKGYSELTEVMSYCTDCHGESRRDAGISLATYDDAVAAADQSQDVIANGSMPPGGMPAELEDQFFAWAQCGTPE